DKRFDEAAKALDRPMTVYEFYRIVAPVVAAIKCGHTGVRVNPDLAKGNVMLPLVVRVLDGKVYVLKDLSGGKNSLAGQELRAVNGVARVKIVQTMLAAASGDGDVQTSRMRNIDGANFSTNLIDLLGLHSPYTVTLWDPKQSREHTVVLEGIEASKLREQRPKDSATLTFFDDGMIADLKIHRFGGKANDKNLDAYIREAFGQIDQKKRRTLILDLRDNACR